MFCQPPAVHSSFCQVDICTEVVRQADSTHNDLDYLWYSVCATSAVYHCCMCRLQGPYVVTISVTSGEATEVADQLLCLEVDFEIAPPGAADVLEDISSEIKSKLHSGRRALA